VRILVIWKRPNGMAQTVETDVSPNDPHKDNEGSLLTLAKARASAFFTLRFGEMPRQEDLSARVIR
jgi:hypothetical protein